MSIATKLQTVKDKLKTISGMLQSKNNDLSEIKQALIDKNAEITDDTPTSEYSSKIEQLTILPETMLNITGDCSYKFAGSGWNAFLEEYEGKITSNNITNLEYMFNYSNLLSIPFQINIDSSAESFYAMFNKSKMQYISDICFNETNNVKNISCMFIHSYDLMQIQISGSFRLKEGSSNASRLFEGCYKLRELPDFISTIYDNYKDNSSIYFSSVIYYRGFMDCMSLTEIKNLPVIKCSGVSNNMFYLCIENTILLKRFMFETDNGVPHTAKWKGQLFYFLNNVGYINQYDKEAVELAEKEFGTELYVYDTSTYEALKNNEYWWTKDINYSRYNHDSAVETINSLPDTSAYLTEKGGTNTITFKGESGALTDGGAINTLTEEEIAVAAAKGWTVALT